VATAKQCGELRGLARRVGRSGSPAALSAVADVLADAMKKIARQRGELEKNSREIG